MTLPPLTDWGQTAHSLHKAARLLGTLRLLLCAPLPNYLQLALKVLPDGLSTDILPRGGEVILNFEKRMLVVRSASGIAREFGLADYSQAALFETLLDTLKADELAPLLANAGNSGLIDTLFKAIQGGSYVFLPNREDLTDTHPLDADSQLARDYARVLYEIFTGVARFRARLSGNMTPVVVWPHHFDLSFLWFSGAEADEKFPHMNFGFSPFTPGIDGPYLYAYASPLPEGYGGPQLPPQAHWHTEGWKGVVVPYDKIAQVSNAALFVEDTCLAIYKALLPIVRG